MLLEMILNIMMESIHFIGHVKKKYTVMVKALIEYTEGNNYYTEIKGYNNLETYPISFFDLNSTDSLGRNPISMACHNSNKEIVQALIRYADEKKYYFET